MSAKTSLRERYKQADLEAVVLKNIHRKAECYVVSRSTREIEARQRNMDDVMAIDQFIHAERDEYDLLLEHISKMTLILAPEFRAVTSTSIVKRNDFSSL